MLGKVGPFGGIIPKIRPRYLPDTAAQDAMNCKFGGGGLQAWKDVAVVDTPSKAGTKLTIFPYLTKWLHWITDVNVCKSPVVGDTYSRIYWTGDGYPKMTGSDVAVSGPGTDYPTTSYLLGLPAPASPITVTLSGSITDPDPTLVETRQYVYTYVSFYGEEGPPSTPSTAIDWAPGQTADLASMSTAPTSVNGNYRVTAKRIYRTNTGSATTEYQFVAEIAVATTTYADNIASADLGEVLATDNYDAPPSDLIGLIALPNGALAGISGKTLCVSVPYQPHAWPTSQQIPFDETPVALGAYGISIHVATTGTPYRVNGPDPANLGIPERIEEGTACTFKRGLVDFGEYVMYPATDGLVIGGVGVMSNATAEIMDRDDWQEYLPSLIIGYAYAGLYFGFNGSTAFIFNPRTKDFTPLDIQATAGYRDPADGKLYLQIGDDIVQWDATGTKTVMWKSKPFSSMVPVNMSCAAVIAPTYPVTVEFYADGVLKHTQATANKNPFRLPGGYLAETWEIKVNGPVDFVLMSTGLEELKRALK